MALGGFSVVGPGPLAPTAAAAEYTGGTRGADGAGAVEVQDQLESDLTSCDVGGGTKSGSQAGFSWATVEPSETSDDKTQWGLSVSFDNSKDRTFADWSFSSSANLNNFLDTGQVPSMEAGQTFIDKNVTHKADENINISASGRALRNLNLFAELTDEKVKQFASASADDPVRYAWQSNYKQDNHEGPKATQGGSAQFRALVNPWPSENNECNRITVSWERLPKHVIQPGEETKVGQINIPKLSDGNTDDSLDRMVAEAYDGNRNFMGNARIDKHGAIFFTWPEYVDTERAAQQNINFSVIAQPREVEDLQKIVDKTGYGVVSESSNLLERYNKPNVIDNRSFSLDDTGDHDPRYEVNEKTIISGVDSKTGSLAEDRQEVVFKQIPDLIADLVKKKDQGGYNAKVELDDSYVFEGWDAVLDPETNDVTITAPEEPTPGTFAQARVVVTYSNGSKDEIPLLVVVKENNTQTTDVEYPFQRGPQTVELSATPELVRIFKKSQKPIKPESYAIEDGWQAPEGWTVDIHPTTGEVTAKADASVADNTILKVPVVATYKDKTTDETTAQFQVASSVKVPRYKAGSGKAGEDVPLNPEQPNVGLGGREDDEEPNRYTFEDGTTTFTSEGDESHQWTFTIDENTGVVTAHIPEGALPGAFYSVPVVTHYASGTPAQTTTATVNVVGSGDGSDLAIYNLRTTRAGQPVESKINTQLSNPSLAQYTLGEIPAGWSATIAEDGTVTATPDETQQPGATTEIPVSIVYPDGSQAELTAEFEVVGNDAHNNDPLYPTVIVKRGDEAVNLLNTSKLNMDRVASFDVITDPNDEGYVAPPRNRPDQGKDR